MVDSSPQRAPLDRYVVLEYLSEGGMGAIYLGKKLGAGGFAKEVVLKQLLPEFTSQPEFRDLFLREAKLSATLDHANIIHTIDLVSAGDEFFIVMEYLPGADLRTLLKKAKRRRQVVSPAAGIYIAREVLAALAYAHAKHDPDGSHLHLIHRDVSPSNILVSRIGEVKLTDFGIAKAATHNSVFYRVKGKVGYMSPEQARSETLDHRSDLYSLAVCLYEMVAGERLFVHVGLTTSAEQMYSQPIPLVSRKVRGVPPEFDKLMLKALAVDPNHRYQSAGEFQEALLRCAHRAGLMMSAPELAAHLHESCGDPDQWRNVEDDRPEQGTAGLGGGGGTALYGDDELAASENGEDDLVSVADDDGALPAIVNERKRRASRAHTSLTNLDRLRSVELTSMVKMAALEDRGAEPLVNLDELGEGFGSQGYERKHFGGAASLGSAGMGPARPARGYLGAPGGAADPDSALGRRVRGLGDGLESIALPGSLGSRDHSGADSRAAQPTGAARRSRIRAWVIITLIIMLGVGAAAAIGLSGPDIQPTIPDLSRDPDLDQSPAQRPQSSRSAGDPVPDPAAGEPTTRPPGAAPSSPRDSGTRRDPAAGRE